MLKPMLTGKTLIKELESMPEYNTEMVEASIPERLLALNCLYDLYIPSPMTVEIYNRLYLAMANSLNRKNTLASIRQQNNNYFGTGNGVQGGINSFSIIGVSGLGKTSAISRCITAITDNEIIVTDKPYSKTIPFLSVQCPFDCSVKSLLLEILHNIDLVIGSNYFSVAVKTRETTDRLILTVSQCCINHISLLIIDEIQNVANSRNGKNLIGSLTQLINNSGICICLVGTPESTRFFESAVQLARRSIGLNFGPLNCDDFFRAFCNTVYNYQFVKYRTELTDGMIDWLYHHSGGITSVVISLFHDAQEIAILNGLEVINIETLTDAFNQRLKMLHGYVSSPLITNPVYKPQEKPVLYSAVKTELSSPSIIDFVKVHKDPDAVISFLKQHFSVMEAKV